MLGYHVEVREDFDLPWSRVTTEPIPDTTHRVTGLRPGQEYEFRVVGVTEIGVGRPSEPSFPPKMAREPAGGWNMKLIIWNIDGSRCLSHSDYRIAENERNFFSVCYYRQHNGVYVLLF